MSGNLARGIGAVRAALGEPRRARAVRAIRLGLLLLIALGGAAFFLRRMHGHYPVGKWLFWVYAEAWACTLLVAAACLCAGDLVVARVLRPRPPLRERLLISFAVGVYIFCVGLFVAGLLHGLGPVFFLAWPLGLIAVGADPLIHIVRRVVRLLPHARRAVAPPSWLGGLALIFGLAGAALLYVNIMTPANVGYDSRWYHLALAEHYAAAGAVTRFPEGWFCSTYPHLASFLYTWAWLVPGGDQFLKIEIAAHLEFLLFALTLSGVAILARWCTAGQVRLRNAWAALFLFPGIFLYDSSLIVAADHVLAFWAPPMFLLLRRTVRTGTVSSAALLGLMLAGAVLTKYQSVSLVLIPPAVVLAVAVRRSFGRGGGGDASRRLAAWRIPLATAISGLVLTTPLWLKNWIWHGDPLYPLLHDIFPARPWLPGTDPSTFLDPVSWTPQGPFLDRLRETLLATVTFSFVPHDWWNHHADFPVFGSLFTLTLPLLLFVKQRRRTVAVAAATMFGLAVWYWTYHQDRYLQALLPWMAAVVAAVLAMVWRLGWTGRIAAVALVAVQVVWGGDVYSFPTHAMIGGQPAKATLDLLSGGFRKDWQGRRNSYLEFAPVAPLLPPGSTVLVHERHVHTGLGARSVSDIPGTQAAISYARLYSPRRVYDLLRSLGVTHVLWSREPTQVWQSSVDDLVFFEFAEKHTVHQVPTAGFVLGEMPPEPPSPVAEPRLVRVQLCASTRTVLLHQLDAAFGGAKLPEPPPSDLPGLPAFHVIQGGCGPIPADRAALYRQLPNRGPTELWTLR